MQPLNSTILRSLRLLFGVAIAARMLTLIITDLAADNHDDRCKGTGSADLGADDGSEQYAAHDNQGSLSADDAE